MPKRDFESQRELWEALGKLPLDCTRVWATDKSGTFYANRYNRTKQGHRIRCKFFSIERDGRPHVLAVRYE